jgi:3-phenylpropionate/cinnamic acid dioxygenase small subunit
LTNRPDALQLHVQLQGGTTMTGSAAQSAEEKIRRTLARFCHFTDTGAFDAWVRLFVHDGCFAMMGQEHRGPEELRAFIEEDQPPERRGMHLTTDSLIEIADGEARASSNFIFVAAGKTTNIVVATGRYHDILVPAGEEWLFARREAEIVGSVASEPWGAGALSG